MRVRPRRAGSTLGRLLAIVAILAGCVDAGQASPSDRQVRSAPPLEHDFGRIIAEGIDLWSEPGGGMQIVSTSGDLGLLVPILDRRTVGGVEWVHIEHWSPRGSSRFVWMPTEADVETPYGPRHGPTIEPATPDCQALDGTDADAMAWTSPPVRLACLGGGTLKLGPVFVGSWRSDIPAGGDPAWLAVAAGVRLYGPRGWTSRDVGLDIQLDPAASLNIPVDTWVNVVGQFDHPAAATCVRTGAAQESIGGRELHVLWCRQRFVVTAVTPAEPPPAEPSPAPLPVLQGEWRVTAPAPIAGRTGHSGIWTGTEMIVWGGEPGPTSTDDAEVSDGTDGAAYNPVTDAWRRIDDGPLGPRSRHVAVWTGREVLIWGGFSPKGTRLTDGAAYDPATDRWRPLAGSPLAGVGSTVGVWAGERWFLVDGITDASAPMTAQAAAYDPTANAWTELPSVELPASWAGSVVWTGSELLLIANPNQGLSVGVGLDPTAAAWRPLAAPPFRGLSTGVPFWTGSELVLQSRTRLGEDPRERDLLFLYDPARDTWRFVETPPTGMRSSEPIWNGSRAFFVAGSLPGNAFDPAEGRWYEVPPAAPRLREFAVVVWTGDRLITWGGFEGESFLRPIDGRVFVPSK